MSSKVDDELDNMLKKHINIVGDGWWHPNYGYSEMKAELLALISEQVRLARIDTTKFWKAKAEQYDAGLPMKMDNYIAELSKGEK